MHKLLLFFALLFQGLFFSLLWSKEPSYNAQICKSAKDPQDKIDFTSEQVTKIVNNTGMDQRSICSFITLGSQVYPLPILKQELLDAKNDLKVFLNEHYLFPKNQEFFSRLSEYLFSNKYSDSVQVLNTLILNDLLYGYTIGDTIPIYMEEFLYYSANNTNNKEQEALNRIIPYVLHVESNLLGKKEFSSKKIDEYLKEVQNIMKKSLNSNGTSQNSVLKDNAY